eukprot:1145076-Pelagomonas_calceolata.AAC.3
MMLPVTGTASHTKMGTVRCVCGCVWFAGAVASYNAARDRNCVASQDGDIQAYKTAHDLHRVAQQDGDSQVLTLSSDLIGEVLELPAWNACFWSLTEQEPLTDGAGLACTSASVMEAGTGCPWAVCSRPLLLDLAVHWKASLLAQNVHAYTHIHACAHAGPLLAPRGCDLSGPWQR